jgi:chromosome segregation ATPase
MDRAVPSTQASLPVAASPAPRPQAESLIAYLARLRGMNEAALAAEAARQKQLAARASDDMTRLKAALALALAMQSDESDILALADPLARKENATADVRAMASFLQVLANERRRLKESATAARTSLRDERRALEAQKQRADASQERAAQLQQKLDALTELEKSLSDRPPPSR